MMKLTDLNKGTTVTTSVIHAGENTSSIPDLCKLYLMFVSPMQKRENILLNM